MEPSFKARSALRHPMLMIPGPVDVSEEVLAALSAQVVPHYGADWTALYKETTTALRRVFQTGGEVFLMVGPGTCGLDAGIHSLFAPGEKVLVAVNGFFGDRLVQLARARGLQVVEAAAAWGEPVSPASVEALLAAERGIAGLLAVQHETSTGVLNPVREYGALARSYGVPFLVDAVSSLGGEELQMDAWGVDICVTASNKCLESVPGVAPVAVGANAWKVMQSKQPEAPGWYLNLRTWKQYLEDWGDWHPSPVTLPTNTVLALNAALEALFREGLEKRLQRYQETARVFRGEMTLLGFDLYVSGEQASSCVSAVRRLPGMDIPAFITYLRESRNIHIAGGLGETRGLIFRVGHMGKAGSPAYLQAFLEAVRDYPEVRKS